jgi:hypothetical protein
MILDLHKRAFSPISERLFIRHGIPTCLLPETTLRDANKVQILHSHANPHSTPAISVS